MSSSLRRVALYHTCDLHTSIANAQVVGAAQDSHLLPSRHTVLHPLCIAQHGLGGWTNLCQGWAPRLTRHTCVAKRD